MAENKTKKTNKLSTNANENRLQEATTRPTVSKKGFRRIGENKRKNIKNTQSARTLKKIKIFERRKIKAHTVGCGTVADRR